MRQVTFRNSLKQILKEKEFALGAFLSINSPSIVEIVAISGLDFVVLDTEHAPMDVESIENMIRAAELYDITPIVRVTGFDPKLIGRYMDIGAHGIQVPMVHTPEMAAEVVKAVKYAPYGCRGMSGGRATRWATIRDYSDVSNRESMVVCMCESREAIDNIHEIVKTPMLDVVFIGTADLSQNLGHSWQISHPEVEESILKVVKACKGTNVVPGIVTGSVEEAKRRISQGFKYVTVMNDMRLMMSAASDRIARIREMEKTD